MAKKAVKKTAKKAAPKPVRKTSVQKTAKPVAKKAAPARAAAKPAGKAAPVKKASEPAKKAAAVTAPPIPLLAPTPAKSATRGLSRGASPAPQKTTLDTLYIVNESDTPITLEVNIGAAGQTSDMTITLDTTTIVNALAGDFAEKSLGTNKQLNGKKLSIAATIADTSRTTNLTSLTIHLKGGVAPNDFPLSKTVNDEGDSEDYLCTIEFFNPLL